MSVRALSALAATAVLVLAAPERARAADAGVRGGYYAEAGKAFLGGDVLFRLGERVQLGPSLEVLDGGDGHHVVGSVDALYDITCACSTSTLVWAGAGVSVLSRDDAAGSTVKPGLDLLLGFGLATGRVIPYVQLKAILKEDPDLALGIGVRF